MTLTMRKGMETLVASVNTMYRNASPEQLNRFITFAKDVQSDKFEETEKAFWSGFYAGVLKMNLLCEDVALIAHKVNVTMMMDIIPVPEKNPLEELQLIDIVQDYISKGIYAGNDNLLFIYFFIGYTLQGFVTVNADILPETDRENIKNAQKEIVKTAIEKLETEMPAEKPAPVKPFATRQQGRPPKK